MGRGRKEGVNKGTKNLSVRDIFTILITVMILWGYTCVKTYQIVIIKYVQFLVR